MRQKPKLTEFIKTKLLSREVYQGALADAVGTKVGTITVQLRADSPTLTLPNYQAAIREILKGEIDDGIDIVEMHPVNTETFLHQ